MGEKLKGAPGTEDNHPARPEQWESRDRYCANKCHWSLYPLSKSANLLETYASKMEDKPWRKAMIPSPLWSSKWED